MTLKFYDDGTGNSYTAMGVPGQLSTSNVTSNSADLTLPADVTGAQYYELSESTDNGSTWTVVDSAIAPGSIVSPATYSRSGLTSGATYQWRLRAKFASLVSPVYSAVRSIFTISSSGTGSAFSYSAPSGVAHGNIITITPNSGYTIPQRVNVKPLRVELNDNSGNALGRLTDNYRTSFQYYSWQTSLKLGSLAGAWTVDLSHMDHGASTFTSPTDFNYLLDYQERYYGFDITNSSTWSPVGDANKPGINLKSNRFWGPSITYPDSFIGYQGAEGQYSWRAGPELTNPGYSSYLNISLPPNQWLCEMIILKQSSAVGSQDGYLRQMRDANIINTAQQNFISRDSTYPNKYKVIVQDQCSNGGTNGYPSGNPFYYGYRCVDDEIPGIFIGDANTISGCTKLVKLPQTSWPTSTNQNAPISAQLIESFVTLSSGFIYILKGLDSVGSPLWLSTDGVAL